MDTLDNQSFNTENSAVPQEVVQEMRAATPWMKFMAILGFIYTGFIIIMALVAVISAPSGAVFLGVLLQLAFACIPFFISMFLWQYASNLAQFTDTRSNASLLTAFIKQKAYWRLTGIITIIAIAFMIIALIFAASMGSLFGSGPFGF